MENKLQIGYARTNITPPLGIDIAGYFVERHAEAVLDELEACAMAIRCGDKSALIITLDLCYIPTVRCDEIRLAAAEAAGIAPEAVLIHATHTHQGPVIGRMHKNPIVNEYFGFLLKRVADTAVMALADLKEAKVGIGIGEAKNVAFIRRYRMKDGGAMTNPGVNNPDIVAPIGETDERVSVVRFDRDGADTVVLANFANHPDVVGGNKISADWPGITRRMLERAIDGTRCIFLNGAQGDVNHVNVHPKAGDFNDL